MDITSLLGSRKAGRAKLSGHVPGPPRVDLLPGPMRARHTQRRRQRTAVVVAAATVTAVLGISGMLAVTNQAATGQLEAARAEADALAVTVAKYAPVTSLAAQTQALTLTVQTRGEATVDQAEVLERFLDAVDGSLQLTSVDVVTGEEAGSGCASTDPFHDVVTVGCVSFTGTAIGGHAGASQALRALSDQEWFTDPFIPSVSSGQEGAPVSGSVALSELALPEQAAAGEDLPAPGTEASQQEGN